jgi:hypothetical protein
MHEMIRRLVTEFDLDQVILFGSQAWADPGQDSDLGLLVVVPARKERPIARGIHALRCRRGIPVPMDLL